MKTRSSRVLEIDFVKGALVVAMVVYHVLNYLGFGSLPRQSLGFLPTSFIMITGFLLMEVYGDSSSRRPVGQVRRLFVRGAKLLGIFTVLNVAARIVWQRNHYGVDLGVSAFFDQWFDVYVRSSGSGVAFDVLVPISYTIWMGIPLLALQSRMPRLPVWLAIGAVACCMALELAGQPIVSLYFVSAGTVGLWVGTRGLAEVTRAADSRLLLFVLAVGYAALQIAALESYPAQMFMTMFALLVLYAIARRVRQASWWAEEVNMLGRYSLLSYIVQILALQGTGLFVNERVMPSISQVLVFTTLVAAAMWAIVRAVDIGRRYSVLVDRAYKAVFA